MKVEHWQAQSTGQNQLRWRNLLGVCLGDAAIETGSAAKEQHCDTSRGDAKLFLHPVEGEGPSPREHLRYTPTGEVRASENKPELSERVQSDISALNLNANRLRRARLAVFDALCERLDKDKFSKAALAAELRAASIEPNVPASEHCEMVRYHLQRWARKNGWDL